VRAGKVAARTTILWTILFPAACSAGKGGGGNPVAPSTVPSILSIEPVDAAPGDHVTIRGTGMTGEGLVVTFDGVPALLISATTTSLLVVVPDVPQGDHSVAVTAGGRASAPFRYSVAPAFRPTIFAIQPAGAHVWDQITITGRDFRDGPQAPIPGVFVGGVRAPVSGSPTSSRIVVNVPVVARGSTTVQIRSGAGESGEFPFEVLHSTPVVTAVSPNPSRVGLRVTIEGEHLAGPETAVLVDGIPAAIQPLTGNTQIVATVPPVTAGAHTLQVVVEGELATPIPLEIDEFDATGIYDVRSEVLESRSDVFICPRVGTVREYPIELLDIRPDLTLRIGLGAPELRGSVDSAGGIHAAALSCSNPLLCGFSFSYLVAGRVNRRESDARYEIDATIVRNSVCSAREHVTGSRR
jgi:hypothetical protein